MSEFIVNLNAGKTDEKGQFRLLGKILTGSGVIETTSMTVAAQASPDLTVKISGSAASDNIVFVNSSGDTYHGWNTASYNVTINGNASGVTKKDTVIAYANTAGGSATANNPGGLVFLAVRGSGTDTAPTDGELNTATSNKPWVRLANVQVANGASSINSGNITDVRTRSWTVGAKEVSIPLGFVGVSSASYATVDASRKTIDFSKLMPGVTAAYFSVTANTGGAGTFTIQLYNITDGAAITSSEISTTSTSAAEIRSGDIKANLPAISKLIGYQAKQSTGGSAVWRAELILQY